MATSETERGKHCAAGNTKFYEIVDQINETSELHQVCTNNYALES